MQMGSQVHVSEAGTSQLGLSSPLPLGTISWMLAASERQWKRVAVSIQFLGEVCPAQRRVSAKGPSSARVLSSLWLEKRRGISGAMGQAGSSAACCAAGCYWGNRERGWRLPPCSRICYRPVISTRSPGSPAPIALLSIRPTTVQHMGSYRGGGWRQLCCCSGSSRGVCSLQQ